MTLIAKIPHTPLYCSFEPKNSIWNIYVWKEGHKNKKQTIATNVKNIIPYIKTLVAPEVYKDPPKTKKSLINLIINHHDQSIRKS